MATVLQCDVCGKIGEGVVELKAPATETVIMGKRDLSVTAQLSVPRGDTTSAACMHICKACIARALREMADTLAPKRRGRPKKTETPQENETVGADAGNEGT